jgi:hypothetical protein
MKSIWVGPAVLGCAQRQCRPLAATSSGGSAGARGPAVPLRGGRQCRGASAGSAGVLPPEVPAYGGRQSQP